MQLTSPAFVHGGAIPAQFTCEGDDRSPALAWSDLPAGTESLALIVDDPDAPDPRAPKRVYVHWVLYNLPGTEGGLVEGVQAGDLPAGAMDGRNDWHRTGWGGPCPPIGRHRYFFRLYALDRRLEGLGQATKPELLAAMEGHILAQAELMGTYEKTGRKG